MHARHTSTTALRWGFVAALALTAGSALAATVPSFTITAPTDRATVSSPVTVTVALTNAKLGKPTDGLDHLHISVDGGQPTPVYKDGPVTLPLAPGKHTVKVELSGPTHRTLLPPKSVTFTVK